MRSFSGKANRICRYTLADINDLYYLWASNVSYTNIIISEIKFIRKNTGTLVEVLMPSFPPLHVRVFRIPWSNASRLKTTPENDSG